MERRYKMLAKVGVRNIVGFNEKLKNNLIKPGALTESEHQNLPYIVLVIDELADLMMTAANEVESHIVRIAQLARAVGIHLVVATQRPSTNVITGIIKANMPSRIAFQVASKVDSRVVIDQNGADKLLGRGDMLFIPPGVAESVRLHGAFVSDSETEAIVDAIKNRRVKAERLDGWMVEGEEIAEGEEAEPTGGPKDADLVVEAAKLVARHQLGSTSLLQRRLKVGYARAGRLMDELEEMGIVGAANGSKARDVLIDEGQLEGVLAIRK
jgi:S-DNA-T family DNA segregation ATPase FtsK/SpoIIIE